MKRYYSYFPAFLILVFGLVATMVVHRMHVISQLKIQDNEMQLAISQKKLAIQNAFQRSISAIEILKYYIEENENLTRQEFELFCNPIMLGNPGFKALSWVPRVEAAEKTKFEEELQKDFGKEFQITHKNSQKQLVAAPGSLFYFSVKYIEPFEENKTAVGYDIHSENTRKLAIENAIKTGQLSLTGRIKLVQDTTGYSFLAFLPVYNLNSDSTVQKDVAGVISAVFKIDLLINNALSQLHNAVLKLVIYDVSDGGRDYIYGNENVLGNAEHIETTDVTIAGRNWELNFVPGPDFTRVKNSWQYALTGIFLSFMIFFAVLLPLVRNQKKREWQELLNSEKQRRKKTEKSLSESEMFNKTLFDEASIGLVLATSDRKLVQINPEFERITGRTIKELQAMNYWELTPEKYRELEKTQVEHLLNSGILGPYEKEYIHKNGHLVPVRLHGKMIERAGGKYIWASVEDITEIKKAENKLKESEEHFRTIFEQSASGMCITALDGKLIKVNQPLCNMLGYKAEELEGLHFNDITHPEDKNIGLDVVRQMISGKTDRAVFEKRYIKKTGEMIWIHINSVVFRDAENRPEYFITQMEDITSRIISDNLLKSSEKKFKALVEQSLTGIYIFEKDKFLYVNNRFCEIFGYSEEEILNNLKPTDVVQPEEREMATENIEKRMRGEVQSVHYFAKGNRKDKKPLWIEIHGTHILLEGKDVITGTVLDITEQKNAILQIEKLNKTLEQKVVERTRELEDKNDELERMNKLFVGRELRMIELKEKIENLRQSQ